MPLPNKRVTLSDIAKALNISKATVSLALNDKGALLPGRRAEIKRIAKKMNYRPNSLAQALRGASTRTIGVVTNYFSNIYFRDFYTGLEEVADAHGFSFMVSQAYESLEKERRQVEKFAQYGVDGLIVLPCSQEKDHLTGVVHLGIPVVLISNTLGDEFAAVVPDNIRGTELAVSYLLETYERPIFHIAGPQNQSSQLQRRETFCRIVERAGSDLPCDKLVYNAGELRSQAGYECMERIIHKHAPPFSLFVCNDETATGVIYYARERGLRIPEDVAIACFSGDTSFSALGLPVTTVAVQAKRMGEATARLLLDFMERPEELKSPPVITLPVVLTPTAFS